MQPTFAFTFVLLKCILLLVLLNHITKSAFFFIETNIFTRFEIGI